MPFFPTIHVEDTCSHSPSVNWFICAILFQLETILSQLFEKLSPFFLTVLPAFCCLSVSVDYLMQMLQNKTPIGKGKEKKVWCPVLIFACHIHIECFFSGSCCYVVLWTLLAAIVIVEGRDKLECSSSVIISYSYNQIYLEALRIGMGLVSRYVLILQGVHCAEGVNEKLLILKPRFVRTENWH